MIYIVITHLRTFPRGTFLPFLAFLDTPAVSQLLRPAATPLFYLAAVVLLFNRAVRVAAAVLGVILLLSVLASRLNYSNNRLLFACIFILASLQSSGKAQLLFRLSSHFPRPMVAPLGYFDFERQWRWSFTHKGANGRRGESLRCPSGISNEDHSSPTPVRSDILAPGGFIRFNPLFYLALAGIFFVARMLVLGY